MRSRSPEDEGADPGALPVAGRVLSRSAALCEGLRPLRTPDRGEGSPAPPITPAAPFSLSLDGRLNGARSDGDAFDHNGEGSAP